LPVTGQERAVCSASSVGCHEPTVPVAPSISKIWRNRGSIVTAERAKAHLPSRDPSEFGSLIEPYRGELRLHCYRLLGSLHEAEDLVQETMLRAWQYADTFKGQASLRTWLYRIATNACLDVLKKRPPRTLPAALTPEADPLLPLAPAWAESTWLEPFPDSWLAQATEDPAARFARRESVSLAFLVALQLLPPRQRAILLLSDVLDWHASEIASLLSISVSAVKSALHRARVTLSKQYHADEQERGAGLRTDAATQALLERYMRAWESENIDGLVALMKEDATFTMPPLPSWYRGREAIRAGFTAQIFAPLGQNRWHFSPTEANGGPAFAVHRAAGPGGPSRALGIQIVTLAASASDVRIAEVTFFLDPWFVTSFGFPQELPS
jgi:RNA polymerase sigma-70 factor (ECF subfamily)